MRNDAIKMLANSDDRRERRVLRAHNQRVRAGARGASQKLHDGGRLYQFSPRPLKRRLRSGAFGRLPKYELAILRLLHFCLLQYTIRRRSTIGPLQRRRLHYGTQAKLPLDRA